MKVVLRIDPSLRRTQVVVCAPANTPEVQALVQRLSTEGAASTFTAFREGQALLLPLGDILRFFADGKGVSCQTAGGVYAVRQRLYELEETLGGFGFVRISNSEIVNLKKVRGFDLSFAGTICVSLSDGSVTYVSRRYVSKIKQVLGI